MNIDNNEISFRKYLVTAFCFGFLFFGAVWLWVFAEPMAFLEDQYPVWRAKLQMSQSEASDRVIIMGDSRPVAALIPDRLGSGVVNLALPGGGPIEMYYMAQRLVARASPPKSVIISLSPIHFVMADGFWIRGVEFDFLNAGEVDEVRTVSRDLKDDSIFGPKSPGDAEARFKSLLYRIKFPSYYFPSLYAAHLDGRYAENQIVFKHMYETRGQMFFGSAHGTTAPDMESAMKSFVPSKVLEAYFDRTLSLFSANHIPVYFIAIPHNAVSDRLYFPGFREKFVDYLQGYESRYPNFHVLGDPFPSYPSEDFGDAHHMNPAAAAAWSDHASTLLNEAHAEGGPFGPVPGSQ